MDAQEQARFTANWTWFNDFFSGLKQLFDKTARLLRSEFGLSAPKFYHYPQPRTQPGLPQYYIMGLGGERFAVQVFAVLDLTLLENQVEFVAEPSLVIVKHSRGDKALYLQDYGLRVIRGDGLADFRNEDGWVSGLILASKTRFQAFQVPFDAFAAGKDVEAAIRESVVEVLKRMPELPA